MSLYAYYGRATSKEVADLMQVSEPMVINAVQDMAKVGISAIATTPVPESNEVNGTLHAFSALAPPRDRYSSSDTSVFYTLKIDTKQIQNLPGFWEAMSPIIGDEHLDEIDVPIMFDVLVKKARQHRLPNLRHDRNEQRILVGGLLASEELELGHEKGHASTTK